jgi:Zn finger protein HypA/HybF involved in hydrogenase expression
MGNRTNQRRAKVNWQKELNAKRLKSQGWYGCIAPDGWKDIVLKADEMLSFIDPDYEIHQIKEKFGTLRFYFGTTKKYGTVESNIMYAIERWAEAVSANTCEQCGKHGELREMSWIRTLCDECHGSEPSLLDLYNQHVAMNTKNHQDEDES